MLRLDVTHQIIVSPHLSFLASAASQDAIVEFGLRSFIQSVRAGDEATQGEVMRRKSVCMCVCAVHCSNAYVKTEIILADESTGFLLDFEQLAALWCDGSGLVVSVRLRVLFIDHRQSGDVQHFHALFCAYAAFMHLAPGLWGQMCLGTVQIRYKLSNMCALRNQAMKKKSHLNRISIEV